MVVLYTGDIVNKSVILKKMPESEQRQKLIKLSNCNGNESKMYMEVLPLMERIRQQKSNGVERLFPVCYGVQKGMKGFLLEDLTAVGYTVADRLAGLDFKHAEVAIKGLAEFHALSAVLIERGDLSQGDFSDVPFFVENPEIVESVASTGIKELIRIIEEEWKGEWLSYVDKLKDFLKTAIPKFVDEIKHSDSDFKVLMHGDCWLTNMMFRYNNDGIPLNIRLLDFQIPRFSKPACDLQYFLNMSLNEYALTKKEELLQIYYESLIYFLSLHEFQGKIPTFDHILESYEKLKVFSLVFGLTFKPITMQPVEDVTDDIEEFMKGLNENSMKPSNMNTEEIQKILKIMLKYGSQIGVF